MGQKKIQKALKIFAERAKKNLKAEKVILFGSFAMGKANSFSDVDVMVISKTFAKIPSEKRLDVLYPLTKGLIPDFHPFGLTPREFTRSGQATIISEIKSIGKEI